MSEQIKPCPFCGGDAIKWRRFSSIMACCAESTCPGSGCVCTVEEWNTRVPDATLSAEVERLRGERDVAVMEVSRQAAARGRAEGALATSETAGVVEGWRARAEAAEAESERLKEQVAFTLSDSGRLLRKEDVSGVCPHPDECFEYGTHVRCGPCAIKASAAKGVAIDDTLPNLPEVSRLRRELKAATARAEAAEARVKALKEALHRIANQAWDHNERGRTYSLGYAFSRVQGIARSALSHTKEEA